MGFGYYAFSLTVLHCPNLQKPGIEEGTEVPYEQSEFNPGADEG